MFALFFIEKTKLNVFMLGAFIKIIINIFSGWGFFLQHPIKAVAV